MVAPAISESEPPLEKYWGASLGKRILSIFTRWYFSFGEQDDSLLLRRNVDRECLRNDIDPEIWAEFFLELVSQRGQVDACASIDSILQGPLKQRFLVPGKSISWSGEICHYERFDKFVAYVLKLPIGGDEVIERVARMIEDGECDGEALEGRRLGRLDRPVWVTNDAMRHEQEAERVRDRLGLRSLNQPGHRLVEVRYREAFLLQKKISVKAPTVLDSWQGGARLSWIFAKQPEAGGGPEPGRTVDISCSEGRVGSIEAVHESIPVFGGEGEHFQLRVLGAIRKRPGELSLVGLLENKDL